jgi:hypothetical protein
VTVHIDYIKSSRTLWGPEVENMVSRDTLSKIRQEELVLSSLEEEEETDFEDVIDSGASNAWEVGLMANYDDY